MVVVLFFVGRLVDYRRLGGVGYTLGLAVNSAE
jgi:hypothetical protein